MTLDPLHHVQHAALTRAMPYLDRLPKTVAAEIRVAIAMYEAQKPVVQQQDCKVCEG